MLDKFLSHLSHEKKYSHHTIQAYKNDLTQLEVFLTNVDTVIQSANSMQLRDWIISLVNDGNSATTVNRKIASTKAFYKYLHRMGSIAKNPTNKLQVMKNKKRLPVFVREEEMNQLLDKIEFTDDFFGLRDKLVLELLYGTGIRLSELIELDNQNVSLSKSQIKVMGKGGKERIVPLHVQLVELIKKYLEAKKNEKGGNISTNFIVTNKQDKCYPMFIYRLVKKYLEVVSSAEKKSPHVLRHSFATHLLNKGADLNAIKELLGHANLNATQVYTHNSIENLKSIFNQAHPKA
ncbi:MAG: tyrosine-type recombinase/integrase [Cytophagales bacterium]|nr:tyrosine-type recombinase/integrase [Cytophagales bacterium]